MKGNLCSSRKKGAKTLGPVSTWASQIQIRAALLKGLQVARLAVLGDQEKDAGSHGCQDKGQDHVPAQDAAPGPGDHRSQRQSRKQQAGLGMGKDGDDGQAQGQVAVAGPILGQTPIVEIECEQEQELEQAVHARPAAPHDAVRVQRQSSRRDQPHAPVKEPAPYPIGSDNACQTNQQTRYSRQNLIERAQDKGHFQIGKHKAVGVNIAGRKTGQAAQGHVARGPGRDKLVDVQADLLDVASAQRRAYQDQKAQAGPR